MLTAGSKALPAVKISDLVLRISIPAMNPSAPKLSSENITPAVHKSVFGLRGQTNSIRPLAMHWVYFGDPWLNDLHKEKVTRFWTLYLERRAGQLATFSGDLPTSAGNAQDPTGRMNQSVAAQ